MVLALPCHIALSYVCTSVIVTSELCATGVNFLFHIGNKAGKTDLLFYITEAYLHLSEVCLLDGRGAKT